MMGIAPTEARQLSLHDYQGMLHHWNIAHAEKPPIPEVDSEEMAELEAEAAEILANWDQLVPEKVQ